MLAIPKRPSDDSILQPGREPLISIIHPAGQSRRRDFCSRPTCAGYEVEMGQGRVGRLRGGAHSLVGAADPAQMGQLRNNAHRRDESMLWEPETLI